MGYSTDFEGEFKLNNPLKPEHAAYLRAFSDSRRMHRSEETWDDTVRDAAGLPRKPEYFVGGGGFKGQDRSDSILNYNSPPPGQPGLWCQWVPTETNDGIEWNGTEKFYEYTEWLRYVIEHFLKPWGYALNGSVKWQGESADDFGILECKNNVVRERKGKRTYER